MILYNCLENGLLFLVLLNSTIYPSASSGLYFCYCIIMTAFSLSNTEGRAKLKFWLSVLILVTTFAVLIAKGYFLIKLNSSG